MKLLHEEFLLGESQAKEDPVLIRAFSDIRKAILKVVWPIGSRKFTIHPKIDGNGVLPIKNGFAEKLVRLGWQREVRMEIADELAPGKIDAVYKPQNTPWIAAEWETGNISSSHRALNKMALGLLKGHLYAGILVLPDRELYKYLTQRIGNYKELAPYFPLYRQLKITKGVLAVFSVGYDEISLKAPPIPKQFDGNAIRAEYRRMKEDPPSFR